VTSRVTLPQQRALETRERIIDAAARAFARRGYGQATVNDIAAEAGISMGALYHHFASKEELFRAILDEHLRRELAELSGLRPAASVREVIERLVDFQVDHLQSEHQLDRLFMELWALAVREDWARGPVAGSFRFARDLLAGMLRVARDVGVVRPDLDIEAAAVLLEAVFIGISVQWAIDPEAVSPQRVRQAWADLIERFIRAGPEGDVEKLEERLAALFGQLSGEQAPSPSDTENPGV